MPAEAWRKILYIKDGKCSTFKLDDKFNIISQEDGVRPSVGDYFRIPFVSDPLQHCISISHPRFLQEGMEHLRPLFSQQGDSEFYRFVVLRIRKTAEGQIFTRVQYLGEYFTCHHPWVEHFDVYCLDTNRGSDSE